MTSYLIDMFEVSIARYRACVTAGACTVPTDPAQTLYFESDKENHPISGITRAQALSFCAWDGGRTLPTEAQWEKAARGPDPRDNDFPWGDDAPTCELVNMRNALCDPSPSILQPVNAYPLGVSYYGLFQMGGNVSEFALDNYTQYENITDIIDPYYLDGSQDYIQRGSDFYSLLNDQEIANRYYRNAGNLFKSLGFRCGRRAY